MKPIALNRQLECDDGIFNIRWEADGRQPRDCEWKLVPCIERGKYWCVECGLVVCKRHRKNHQNTKQHRDRIEMWKAKGIKIPSTRIEAIDD